MAYKSEISNDPECIYKQMFKYYKNEDYTKVCSSIIDFANENTWINKAVQLDTSFEKLSIPQSRSSHHFKPFYEWKIYTIKEGIEGLFIIPSVIRKEYRSDWFNHFVNEIPFSKELDLKSNIPIENDCLNKLRWITFGYHHNWDTKLYKIEQEIVTVPDRVLDLCNITFSFLNKSFKPQAGIINYYNSKSTLCFHTDHSELNHEAPLLSLSLGSPAVFLIGGLNKKCSTPIVPILLRDSDLLIMSGNSRLALHAVPKIVIDPNKSTQQIKGNTSLSQICRVNVNVRQVF